MAESEAIAAKCNYAGHYEKYVTCPLAGPLLLPGNICRIFHAFSVMGDVLGLLGSFEEILLSPLYFDRADVKWVIQAPATSTRQSARTARIVIQNMTYHFWSCASSSHTNRTKIGNGLLGLQMHIANDSFLADGVGSLGTAHTEWRLTSLEVELSRHMVPHSSPQHCVPHGILLNTVLKRYDLHRYL
ncbi:hypothetical protein DFH08DRAFT_820728 [Mycena albidolilacea]|uniref:Uncharacterized protein n=1 Tax=Mycena albidolilacea TaxID=1033008 RepID=A0AAD7EE81_9AGAR|nr:hypothetical protein DFH08DRAFT_820728 [Mycena albidolilacea]